MRVRVGVGLVSVALVVAACSASDNSTLPETTSGDIASTTTTQATTTSSSSTTTTLAATTTTDLEYYMLQRAIDMGLGFWFHFDVDIQRHQATTTQPLEQ